jgi:hypothetical protein
MTDANGRGRVKWALNWPMMSRAPAVKDNLPQRAQTAFAVFGCALVLVLLVIEFHLTLRF